MQKALSIWNIGKIHLHSSNRSEKVYHVSTNPFISFLLVYAETIPLGAEIAVEARNSPQ